MFSKRPAYNKIEDELAAEYPNASVSPRRPRHEGTACKPHFCACPLKFMARIKTLITVRGGTSATTTQSTALHTSKNP